MSIRSLRRLAVALALALPAVPAAAQFTVWAPDSARIVFGGRIHTQFATTTADGVPSSDIFLRRVRLDATAYLNDVVSARIQPEFAGSRVSLRDAYVRFTLDPALQLTAGQAHRPFSLLIMTSATRILPIERGVRIAGVADAFEEHNLVQVLGYADRDVGIQLRGEPRGAPLGLGYAVGYFAGPARVDAPNENTHQLVARVTARPLDMLRLGVAWSSRDFVELDDDDVVLSTERGDAWEADVELGSERGGVHLLGEVAWGDSDPLADARFFGAQGWLGYRTGPLSPTISGVEPLLRVSYGDPVTEDDFEGETEVTGGLLVTPGVNVWLGGLNRLQLNYDIWNPEFGLRESSFKAQFQVAF